MLSIYVPFSYAPLLSGTVVSRVSGIPPNGAPTVSGFVFPVCAKVFMSCISFVHVIVCVSSSYVPPAKSHLFMSICVPSGSFAVISMVTFPL